MPCGAIALPIAALHRLLHRVVTLPTHLEERCREERMEEQINASQRNPARGSQTGDGKQPLVVPHSYSS